MLSSLLGRLITGPLAFLVTGIVDFVTLLALYASRRGLARVRAWKPSAAASAAATAPPPPRSEPRRG